MVGEVEVDADEFRDTIRYEVTGINRELLRPFQMEDDLQAVMR
jgi:hypothetical protein